MGSDSTCCRCYPWLGIHLRLPVKNRNQLVTLWVLLILITATGGGNHKTTQLATPSIKLNSTWRVTPLRVAIQFNKWYFSPFVIVVALMAVGCMPSNSMGQSITNHLFPCKTFSGGSMRILIPKCLPLAGKVETKSESTGNVGN